MSVKSIYLKTGRSLKGLNTSREQKRLDSEVKSGLNQNVSDTTVLGYLLMQNGEYLLQQNGDKIIING